MEDKEFAMKFFVFKTTIIFLDTILDKTFHGFFAFLAKFLFNAIETGLDYYQQIVNVQDAKAVKTVKHL